MTDAQQLFDFARNQFNDIANDVERHFDQVASQLRQWIPADTPFIRPPPAARRLPPPTTFQLAQRWVTQHRGITAAAVAFLITGSVGAVVFVRSRKASRKRRARKSASGARTDVIVIAGAPASPLTSALSLDLERRGFVVYVVANTNEDEHYIKSLSRADLLSLPLNLVDPFAAQEQLARFQNLLGREHSAFEGAEPHKLNFSGLILVPDTASTPSKIEEINSEEWSDALNAKVLNTIATTQLFLPCITHFKSRILLLTPSVTPSLQPPLHAIESTVYGALSGFTSTLASELKDEGVSVSHFKLGNLDIPSVTTKQKRDGVPQPRLKATPLRKLHDSIFDALVAKKPSRTWHVGRGSVAYDLIGRFAPPSFVGWKMSLGQRKKVDVVEAEEVKQEDLQSMQSSQGSLSWETIEDDA